MNEKEKLTKEAELLGSKAEELRTQDLKNIVRSLDENYAADKTQFTYNAIIYGGLGTGKTRILETARLPVLVHCFDPGGTITLRKAIEEHEVKADTRFEKEDSKEPTVFRLWESVFNKLRKLNFFDHIGTFAIDSATMFSESIMNAVLRANGRTGGIPQIQDWQVMMSTLSGYMKILTSLPCDCVLTAHTDTEKDEITGRMFVKPMFAGKLKEKLPLLFDEIYMLTTKDSPKGAVYSVLTQAVSPFTARTRIGRDKFDLYEKPDIKHLLKKAGFGYSDKPLFNEIK